MVAVNMTQVNGATKADDAKAEKVRNAEEAARIKRANKKKAQRKKKQAAKKEAPVQKEEIIAPLKKEEDEEGVEFEYVTHQDEEREGWEDFGEVFSKFQLEEKKKEGNVIDEDGVERDADGEIVVKKNAKKLTLESDSDDSDDEELARKKTKKAKKLATRIPVATLKAYTRRPEVVDIWDTTSHDPKLLVHLKAYRNTVAVPKHWIAKRKYMSAKRGLEKPPFKLPEYIETTGIAKIREAVMERDKSLRAKQREKARPAMGKLDIDYQVLHDAFFKYQTKPRLSVFGDMYYEGKEFEVQMNSKKPGEISQGLRIALGMDDDLAPPPWLINMQRYGPPPAYTRQMIPGLNAPIPTGAEYGYHPGGWGKPPVDEMGNPLYSWNEQEDEEEDEFWGVIESAGEESSDEEDEGMGDGTATPAIGTPVPGGLDTPVVSLTDGTRSISGISSITSGLDTPQSMSIRQSGSASISGISSATATPTPQLFQVLEEQKARTTKGQMFPSANTYKYGGSAGGVSTPLTGIQTPLGGISTPIGGISTPIGGIGTPMGGIATPIGGIGTPMGGISTPIGGIGTPMGGIGTPIGGIGTPLGGIGTPIGFGGGIATPIGGVGTPTGIRTGGGVATPTGIVTGSGTPVGGSTLTLNMADMENDGILTADIIRKQLKQHEAKASKAKNEAGIADDGGQGKKRPAEKEKKKKKKFKF